MLVPQPAQITYTEHHLYILRVTELITLSCLKPQVQQVIWASADVNRVLIRKCTFWCGMQPQALLHYLWWLSSDTERSALEALSSLCRECGQLGLQNVSAAYNTTSMVQAIYKGELYCQAVMERRIQELVRVCLCVPLPLMLTFRCPQQMMIAIATQTNAHEPVTEMDKRLCASAKDVCRRFQLQAQALARDELW